MLILNDMGGSVMNVSEDVTACLRAQDHGHPPVICFEPGIARREGSDSRFVRDVSVTLRAQMGDNQPAVCYAVDSHPMDSRFEIAGVYALEGNGSRPSHMGKGWSDDGTMYTLNTIEQHSVCYGISRSCLKGGNGSNGGMPVGENMQPALTANGCGAVVYAIENHPCDSRVRLTDDWIVQTLNARMGTGGGNVPLILEVNE